MEQALISREHKWNTRTHIDQNTSFRIAAGSVPIDAVVAGAEACSAGGGGHRLSWCNNGAHVQGASALNGIAGMHTHCWDASASSRPVHPRSLPMASCTSMCR